MPAAYDSYDYPSYWAERQYEHKSEVIALKTLLSNIPRINTALDIGAGYGRLTPQLTYRAKKIILSDPSSKLLKIARKNYSHRKYKFIHASLENLKGKVKSNTIDLVILIRVIHHLKELDQSFTIISKLCKKNSYFILEYPNKRHIKAVLTNLYKGDFTFPLDIFPKDIRSKKHVKQGSLPFVNYHPDYIKEKLSDSGFQIIKTVSVSNLRFVWFKNNLPTDLVLYLENFIQKYLSFFNLGPSIFVLAKKIK